VIPQSVNRSDSTAPNVRTQEAVNLPEALTTAERLRTALGAPRDPHRQSIGELLVAANCLHDTGVHRALAAQASHPGVRLGDQLCSANEVPEETLYRALSEQLGIPYVRLGEFNIEPAALAALPQDIAHGRRVLPLMFHAGRLVIATDDPADVDTLSFLRFRVKSPIEMVLASPGDLDTSIATHYPAVDDTALESEVDRILQQVPESKGSSVERLAQERPVVRLVENLLQNAVQRRASDIHLQPRERSIDVRYRIDGSLVQVGQLNRALLAGVVARIKVLASMDLAEHRLPQDGSIHFKTSGGAVDMRVSVMPAVHGEDVVIRILDPRAALRRLSEVGFGPDDERRFKALLDRNQGLVLVTGPTGSGKTTTLYAALQELNTGEYHIVTVEDPVEYRLDGVAQIQVHPAIHFDFSRALRNILRHDPDIILIGEIRDGDTAKIAIESALTGHLVLSTLHTNSAAQTVTRLVQIGIQPYLVNATLAGVLAQRLVRRNCDHCTASEQVAAEVRDALGIGPAETFWRGTGCVECSGTGFRGRVAVYELLEMSPAIRQLVLTGASHDRIEAQAVEEGMVRLTGQALGLARAGKISIGEVFRARLE
jgi:type IV pilus assembly protein PilB